MLVVKIVCAREAVQLLLAACVQSGTIGRLPSNILKKFVEYSSAGFCVACVETNALSGDLTCQMMKIQNGVDYVCSVALFKQGSIKINQVRYSKTDKKREKVKGSFQ